MTYQTIFNVHFFVTKKTNQKKSLLKLISPLRSDNFSSNVLAYARKLLCFATLFLSKSRNAFVIFKKNRIFVKSYHMKTTSLIIFFTLAFTNLFGQWNCSDSTKIRSHNNVIGFVPSNAKVTNGWAIGWNVGLVYCSYNDSVQINGLHTNISPLQFFFAAFMLPMLPFALLHEGFYLYREHDNYDSIIDKRLNGVSIGLFELGDDFCVQGLQITGLYHGMGKLNGLSITLGASSYQYFNGVMISGIQNKTKKGNGVQVGLTNKAKEMQGIQIGLWNKIGKRGLPIINMSFKNKSHKIENTAYD